MTARMSLRSQGLTWRVVDQEVVVLDLHTSTYFSVNQSGTALWELLAEGTTLAGMSEHLVQRCGLDPNQAGEDIRTFLAKLEGHGLLAPVGTPSRA